MNKAYNSIGKGEFEPPSHWYDKALNATIHPMVNYFLNLDNKKIIKRYCHLNPKVNGKVLQSILDSETSYFKWAGADLINVTTANGRRQMVIIENNSCPSGQKSMPLLDDHQEMGSYKQLIENTFIPYLKKKRRKVKGGLAVIYDKNVMEASGYAATIAELTGETVHLASHYTDEKQSGVKWKNGVLYIKTTQDEWQQMRAAMRYLTQKPWNRLPLHTKTVVLNPIIACLAGGRNKMMASKAYELFNGEIQKDGLAIHTPDTIWDVSKQEVPLWVERLGGHAVVKVPYSNAGQGVYTIVNQDELNAFMDLDFPYNQFIVQSLIGNYHWSSTSAKGKLYHVGTIPDKNNNTFVADIRMMVSSTSEGIKPLGVYARKAAEPLVDELKPTDNSWNILGTNLSIKNEDGSWGSDTRRLMLADRRDFNKLGLSLDDLIEAFIQTVLSMKAIDRMSINLFNKNKKFRKRLFRSLNDDQLLLNEITL